MYLLRLARLTLKIELPRFLETSHAAAVLRNVEITGVVTWALSLKKGSRAFVFVRKHLNVLVYHFQWQQCNRFEKIESSFPEAHVVFKRTKTSNNSDVII